MANNSIALLRSDVFNRLEAQLCAGSQFLLGHVDLTRRLHSCRSVQAMRSGEAGRIDTSADTFLSPLL
ncbi:MAG: hypothetical protein V3T03_02780 [Candidatus Bipolaricaulota bacterium]